MKNFVLFFILIISPLSFGQNDHQKTKLYIIGTVHESSEVLNPDKLFKILEEINPDILLQENDSEQIANYFKDIKPSSNEQNATLKFLQKYPNTLNLPFEFEGRNSYRKNNGMTPTDYLTIKLIDSLHQKKALTFENQRVYEKYLAANKSLIKFAKKNIEELNSIEFELINKYRQFLQHHEIPKITNSEVIFSQRYVTKPNGEKISYREGYQLWCNFWDLRNNTMAINIIKTANLYKGKKVVVLTGVQHKYYLKELLEKYDDGNYEVIEFFK